MFWGYLPETFVLKAFIFVSVFATIPYCRAFTFVSLRLVDSKRRNFVFFVMLEYKIHGMSQETRPMTCVLDLEGIALG
jgi:hypothetical protein